MGDDDDTCTVTRGTCDEANPKERDENAHTHTHTQTQVKAKLTGSHKSLSV